MLPLRSGYLGKRARAAMQALLGGQVAACLDDQREKVLPAFKYLRAVTRSMVDTRQTLSAFMASRQF